MNNQEMQQEIKGLGEAIKTLCDILDLEYKHYESIHTHQILGSSRSKLANLENKVESITNRMFEETKKPVEYNPLTGQLRFKDSDPPQCPPPGFFGDLFS